MSCTRCRHRPLHCNNGSRSFCSCLGLSRWLLIGALAACLEAEGVSTLTSPSFDPECGRQGGGTGRVQAATGEDDLDITEYLATCRDMQILPSADAIIRLQTVSPNLTITPSGARPFGDLELRALVSLLESNSGAPLQSLLFLDLSACALGPSGMLLVARLLQNPKCSLERLDVSNQPVELEGARRLVAAANTTRSLRRLHMNMCKLGDDGARELAPLLQNRTEGMLEELEIQNNFIGPVVWTLLENTAQLSGVALNLQGNRVTSNILNSVSHGVGFILAVVGTWFMVQKVRGKPAYYMISTVAYCVSLMGLYLFSTLYHAFFAIGQDVLRVFNIFDYAGIFLLIAGSFTPFLGIVFHGRCWASAFLAVLWGTAVLGIMTVAFYTGPYASQLRLTIFLTMGWSALMVLAPLSRTLGRDGVVLLVAGGVLYTAGIPWFVQGYGELLGIPFHTIWHIFVVFGSAAHFLCIYWYVVDGPTKTVVTQEQELESVDAAQSSANLESGLLPSP